MVDLHACLEFLLHLFNGLADNKVAPVKDPVGLLDLIAYLRAQPVPAQTHHINPGNLRRVTVNHDKGRNILHHFRATTHHCHLADLGELMNTAQTANHHPVFHGYMAGQSRVVGQNHITATWE
jgi:hypothetical protein